MNTFVSESGGVLKAWKALLSEAVVTEGKALGKSMLISCLEGSTSLCVRHVSLMSKVLLLFAYCL